MTVEELKAEAKKLGYNIVKIPEPLEPLTPCVCGRKKPQRWFGRFSLEQYICSNCGRAGEPGKKREARHNWNEMIKAEMKREENNGL